MKKRINERNIGNVKIDGIAKKRSNKFTSYEIETMFVILTAVYSAMEEDETTQSYIDGGRITLSLTGEQMYDLFESTRKLYSYIKN
jgi:hypothetical protein